MLMEMERVMEESPAGKGHNTLALYIKHKRSLIDEFVCAAGEAEPEDA